MTMTSEETSPTAGGAASSSNSNSGSQSQSPTPSVSATSAYTATSAPSDAYFFSRLKSQIEFYFSPQNLARDTYLRGLMAVYGGPNALPIVPLSVIASFPKVRDLCAFKTGAAVIPPDPLLLVRAMEGSAVVNISPDAYWISPLLPLPLLDPSAVRKMQQQQQQQQQVGGVGQVGQVGGVTVQNVPVGNVGQVGTVGGMNVNMNVNVNMQHGMTVPVPVPVQGQPQMNVGVGHIPAPISLRQVSAGSGSISNVISTVRTASPLSIASSNDIRSNVNVIPNANITNTNMNTNMNANMNMNVNTQNTSRTTLIVRDIPTDIATEVVMSAFTTETVVPKSATPCDATEKAWYVTFASEQDAQAAVTTSLLNSQNDNNVKMIVPVPSTPAPVSSSVPAPVPSAPAPIPSTPAPYYQRLL